MIRKLSMPLTHTPLILIDCFGIFAFASAISFIRYGHDVSKTYPEFAALWSNLATEGLGIYVGVRAIDWLLRAREARTKSRVGLVRNSRFLLRLCRSSSMMRGVDLHHLQTELDYSKYILSRRKRYLYSDELEQLTIFLGRVAQFITLVNESRDRGEQPENVGLMSEVEQIGQLRRRFEENIFEETAED